jgi:hypothetical protein
LQDKRHLSPSRLSGSPTLVRVDEVYPTGDQARPCEHEDAH